MYLTGQPSFDGKPTDIQSSVQEGQGGDAPLKDSCASSSFSVSSALSVVASKLAPNRPAPDLTALQAFETVFWPAYPRKIGKFEARKAWARLRLKDEDQDSLDAIMAGLARYIADEWEPDRPRFIPHAATWLNQHRWEDFN